MKIGVAALLGLLVTLSACAPARPLPSIDSSVNATPASAVDRMDSRRDIVLAVANPLAPASTHAGSSLLGYAPSAHYGAGQRAVSELTDLKKRYGLQEVSGWPIKALDLYCVVLHPEPGVDRDALIAALQKDERVQLAQPLQDYSVYSTDTGDAHKYNDPYADLQRGFVETDAALAHNASQGEGVRVAIVDTGVDMTHPDLRGHIGDTRNVVDDDTSAFDHDSHGTEVAGIIAAIGDNHQGMVGIAPKARLSVYKACWYPPESQGGARCNSFTLAKALAAVNDTDARIVNLSLGGPADPLLTRLLAKILSEGRIVITAMPPDGKLSGFPDGAPGVIVVRTSATTPAPPGVVSAPGNDILTTQPGGGYDFSSGSSMATAHVSGIVALMLALAPGLDPASIHAILLSSSATKHGMLEVNAAGAVAALKKSGKAPR
ncbi:S8 family serine peptidase [Luteibacter sp. dw_328]|uniref:S8 family serine peptidase n=1 Tax=Luteibacter sp. dw_328 TaxID=2719796 RepID=UPI001BD1F1D4|nr:S8 family serine peptidase [Luteibacter sp. dw_328]